MSKTKCITREGAHDDEVEEDFHLILTLDKSFAFINIDEKANDIAIFL